MKIINQLKLTTTLLFFAFSISILSAKNQSSEKKQFISLFNGNNLSGWTVKCLPTDKDKDFWTVVDGAIECNSLNDAEHDYMWLLSNQEFSDFELKLKFQAFRESPGNSGVQFRSRYNANDKTEGSFWLDGPQVDIDPTTQWRTGLIYDETWGEKRWICPSLKDWSIDQSSASKNVKFVFADDQNGWNDLRIVAKGNNIQTFLNGNLVVDYNGDGVLNNAAHVAKNVDKKGHIALQLHKTNRLKMRYKDIFIREL